MEEYLDGVTMTHQEFYTKLIETDIFPATSQITPYEYEEYFKKINYTIIGMYDIVVIILIKSFKKI